MNVQSAKRDDHKIEDWTRAHYQLGSLLGNSCHIYLSEQPADSKGHDTLNLNESSSHIFIERQSQLMSE